MCCSELKIDVVPGPFCQQHWSEAGQVVHLSLSLSLSPLPHPTISLTTILVRTLLPKRISRVAKSSRAAQYLDFAY
jgi:hypothetical protein